MVGEYVPVTPEAPVGPTGGLTGGPTGGAGGLIGGTGGPTGGPVGPTGGGGLMGGPTGGPLGGIIGTPHEIAGHQHPWYQHLRIPGCQGLQGGGGTLQVPEYPRNLTSSGRTSRDLRWCR